MAAVITFSSPVGRAVLAPRRPLSATSAGEHLSDRESVELQVATGEEYAAEEGLRADAAFRRQWPTLL